MGGRFRCAAGFGPAPAALGASSAFVVGASAFVAVGAGVAAAALTSFKVGNAFMEEDGEVERKGLLLLPPELLGRNVYLVFKKKIIEKKLI
jgi:hypothetical protein